MMPLARLWTWIGQIFIPLAIGWAIYIRNGFGEKLPPDGVLISRGYWGLLIALLAGSALVWTCALYIGLASKRRALLLVPPNTAFEDAKDRSAVISYGTACIFALAVLAALITFGARYSESFIQGWNSRTPVQQGFWSSRIKAHEVGCSSQPCYAVGPRIDGTGTTVFGVNEYILYVTDGVLALFALLLGSGLVYLAVVLTRRPSR
ncbi:hypothetical protein [Bradyrhizobium sp. F1.13.3]|uniref:hypothetical protein n=1 Tax=Bradyrhizobium sp. F1.13.3 TaxID=3156351 RepID=UPI00339593A8